jgi:hypothetical protein
MMSSGLYFFSSLLTTTNLLGQAVVDAFVHQSHDSLRCKRHGDASHGHFIPFLGSDLLLSLLWMYLCHKLILYLLASLCHPSP